MFVAFSIPFQPEFAGWPVNVHVVLEYAAFFVAYRYYVQLRRGRHDHIADGNRIAIILGAALGALAGSRVVGLLENPLADFSAHTWWEIFNVKTIMGGLFGGLLGVELAKKVIGETQSSGDLFTLPLIAGIIIGRTGCFLAGTTEFTYGTETSFFAGMDLGDSVTRHPLALYEILFLVPLYFVLRKLWLTGGLANGLVFKLFMLSYFGFRFAIEFIKPNTFFVLGLSGIQWLCILCFVYYRRTLTSLIRADSSLHVL